MRCFKLLPFSKKSPLDQLLVDGFDAEQIWQQIDLQSQPLLPSLRRRVNRLQKNPEEISKLREALQGEKKAEGKTREEWNDESDGFDEELDEYDEEESAAEDKKEGEIRKEAESEDDEEEEDEDDEEEEEDEEGVEREESKSEEENEEADGGGIEDKFLKIKDLAKYLQEEEDNLENDVAGKLNDDEEGSEDDDESDEAGEFGLGDDEDGDEDAEDLENARYEDFFGAKKEKGSKRKGRLIHGSEDSDDGDMKFDRQKQETISTHEKQMEKIQSKIEQMENANLEPKTWTMQGEVTAAKRPKNSALEVDLDFEHNVRPAPVITEEVTASIEDMIQKRILEGRFDDVQRAPKLPLKAPREVKELDENKSKKGLADIYEEEYVQKTDPASAPLSFKDEQKNEASMLFKKLCLKLDALSHFHFTPKPVIEDISVQANVPALAMEEIAPMAVSDAAMLAPEEVFSGKGDIKEEVELTKEERKRRRANKKRKFKERRSQTSRQFPSLEELQNQRNLEEMQMNFYNLFGCREIREENKNLESLQTVM
ncbi:Mpp10 protein [Senna tora]|uniref:U3 small nucleolar ribonucleoprotein protein MPP10 n=1 Tax=Senna tora TaxID=362788 RepID=A0A834SNR3_9FABA|nr:Mpp10 protein [Senna tora]